MAVLFQTVDATAALIVDRLVESPCASIVLTTRRTSAALAVGGTTIPAGSTILVVLGAAARSDPSSSFGRGPHRCPGSSIATALADGVIASVLEWSGVRALPTPRHWQDRPNLRLPIELVVRRRPHEQRPGREAATPTSSQRRTLASARSGDHHADLTPVASTTMSTETAPHPRSPR